ncbi:FecR family protein [Teredinibacter haidensis]|uniref:FecR family protein n=1 Tax=Teredinibacter haidensis TaxID=2731755 RepID=UPI000948FC91|nr:FecR family protein [Teredinibacter haidensis]
MSADRSSLVVAEEAAIRWLARLQSKNLSKSEEQMFWQWLEASAINQAAYIKAEKLWERGEVLADIPEGKSSRSGWKPATSWVAACAVVLLGVLFIFNSMGNKTESHQFHTAVGQQLSVPLKDGSTITLNTQSRIRVKITNGSRTVYLDEGEAFFDVVKDASRPFDVITPSGVVRVLGTRFSVQETGQTAQVTVLEGLVALGSRSENQFNAKVQLRRNQLASFASVAKGEKPKSVDAHSMLSWRKRQLIFRGQPLTEVIHELQRYHAGKIRLADESLGSKQVTAVIQLSENENKLKALASALGLKVSYSVAENEFLLQVP